MLMTRAIARLAIVAAAFVSVPASSHVFMGTFTSDNMSLLAHFTIISREAVVDNYNEITAVYGDIGGDKITLIPNYTFPEPSGISYLPCCFINATAPDAPGYFNFGAIGTSGTQYLFYGGPMFSPAYRIFSDDPTGRLVTTNGNFEFTLSPVPEPAVWTCMLGGFGLVGAALRRRASAPDVCAASRHLG